MAIPDYQTLMLPLLQLAGDKNIHNIHKSIDKLANDFGLTEEEKNFLLPSGKQRKFANRVGWARTYLKKAGLLSYPSRGHFQITHRGLEVLDEKPNEITNKFLKRFPEFIEFRKRSSSNTTSDEQEETNLTPEETLDQAYEKIRQELGDNLIDYVLNGSPQFFERLVVDLLVAMGYGGTEYDAARAVGKSGDEGIDGIIDEDRLGLDTIFIQAKKWSPDRTVGRPEIQRFVGALQGKRAKKGVFITTSSFSKEAIDYSKGIDSKVVLIDGNRLTNLMIDFGIGVTVKTKYELKRIDLDYFEE